MNTYNNSSLFNNSFAFPSELLQNAYPNPGFDKVTFDYPEYAKQGAQATFLHQTFSTRDTMYPAFGEEEAEFPEENFSPRIDSYGEIPMNIAPMAYRQPNFNQNPLQYNSFNQIPTNFYNPSQFQYPVQTEQTPAFNFIPTAPVEANITIAQAPIQSMEAKPQWNKTDDELLLELANDHRKDWKKVSKKFNSVKGKKLTPNVLKNRFKEITSSDYKPRVKFTLKEDLLIAKYFNTYGTKWEEIAKFFEKRDPIMLKNRYYAHIRKRNLLDTLLEEVRKIENSGNTIDSYEASYLKSVCSVTGYEEERHAANSETTDAEDMDETEIPAKETPAAADVQTQQSVNERFKNFSNTELFQYIAELENSLNQANHELTFVKSKLF